MKPNIPELLKLLSINEKLPVDMNHWGRRTECGTVGCLIGNYTMHIGQYARWSDANLLNVDVGQIEDKLGLTIYQFEWLFCEATFLGGWQTKYRNLHFVTKEQAMKRLRLFVYYHMRKQEKGYEALRHEEGDHLFGVNIPDEIPNLTV